MSFTLVTTQTVLARNAGALYGLQLGTSELASFTTAAGNDATAFLNSVYAASVGSASSASVAAVLVSNLGITGASAIATATAYIQAQLDTVAVSARGAVVNNIVNLFSGLTADAAGGSRFDAVLHAVAFAFDDDGFGVM